MTAETQERPRRPVLVVDDDGEIRQVLRDLLQEEGYSVYCASNGQVALNLLREIPRPCIILLDMMMPVMDGRALLAALSENDRLGCIPRLAMTAAKDVSGLESMPVLRKPFDLEALLALVEDLAHPDSAALERPPLGDRAAAT